MFGEKRSHLQTLGCPTVSGAMRVKLHPYPGSKGKTELGAGTVTVEVYSKSITKRELAETVKAREDNWLRTRRENCHHCYYLRVRCGEDDVRSCPVYLTCLRKRGESPNTCQKLR